MALAGRRPRCSTAAAAAFLGLEAEPADSVAEPWATPEARSRPSSSASAATLPLGGARRGLVTCSVASFAAKSEPLQGDFDFKPCLSGEAIRLDEKGIPYLVDIQMRHETNLDVALFIGFTTLIGTTAFALLCGLNQAKRGSRDAAPSAAPPPPDSDLGSDSEEDR
mmetsp:Transcript_132086/g.294395  ORF Transcript_132086/g.294395 Transcript_132086/m.294395 type:complete len:166 (-) Transcript_132086:15-512(-)